MKILLVVHQFFPESRAGTEVLTLEMAKELIRIGHQVLIVSGRRVKGAGVEIEKADYEGIPLRRINVATSPFVERIRGHTSNIAVESVFREILDEFCPNIVHFNHVMTISASLIGVAKSYGIKVIFSATDFWAICPTTKLYRSWEHSVCTNTEDRAACIRCLSPLLSGLPDWLINSYLVMGKRLPVKGTVLRLAEDLLERNRLMAVAISNADIVLVATRFMAKSLVNHGIPRLKIKHIPFGVNIGSMGISPKVPRADRPLVVGYIGSIVPVKGPQILLNAYLALGPLKSQVAVKIYGDIRAAAGFGETLKKMSQIPDAKVEFCGTFRHTEIGHVLTEMDILVVPSIWYENTPLVLCAALASQTPVLVSDLGGMAEVVEDGRNGFVFRAGDSQALAELIERFVVDTSLAPSLSELMGRAHIKNSQEYVAEVEDCYWDLVRDSAIF